MLTQKTRWTIFILVPVALGLAIGYTMAPTTKTVTVEKPVEKVVEKIVYVPQPVQAQPQQPAQIPFGMAEGTAFRYRQCPEIVTTYVVSDSDHDHDPKSYVSDNWPNFGNIVSTDYIGDAIDRKARIIRITIKKFDCWR